MKAQLAEAGITDEDQAGRRAPRLIADGNGKNFEMISYQWSGRPDPGRQHLPVLQDHAGHVAQLVGHLQSADRRAARQDPRGLEPGRAQEAVQPARADPAGRAADGVHRPPDRAEGVQPAGAGLRPDPGRDDALQGRLAEVACRAVAVGRLILRRLAATIPVLLLVTAGVFALIHLTPGDPIDAMMAESVDATVKARAAARARPRPAALPPVRDLDGAPAPGRLRPLDPQREPVIENVSRRIRPSLSWPCSRW